MTFLGVCPRFVVLQVSVSKGRYNGRLWVEFDLSAYSFEMGFAGVIQTPILVSSNSANANVW